ncbi:MAG: ABC transporter ATP-binding protein [Deltaproteobacteria bacterium]|jgi:Fe-S cluster assembly ATP-binding protein|nr:MAG: ABC transporter ATP-binding protein [Deltaproteobacteria bacterium]
MLEINDLWVDVKGTEVLKGVNLTIPSGETHILFGKNGSGKSSLLMTIMGFSRYKVRQGRISFKGEDITKMPINERSKMGIGLAFQRPPSIRGVKTRDVFSICNNDSESCDMLAEKFEFSELLERELNVGFSGGEMKKSEILQLLLQDPELVMLDEPESGVDLENLEILGKAINKLLEKYLWRKRGKSGLVISHLGFILNYIEADSGYVLMDGRIHCSGNPRELFKGIQRHGYRECIECQR